MPSVPTPRAPAPAPGDPASTASDYAQALELAALIARAPLRHRRLAAAVFLIVAFTSVAAAIFAPRVYVVDTKILAQRNLVMPSLGNPRRSVPSDSDAPTHAAADVILGRENLVAIIKEADLLARWDRERPPILRLKDRVVRAVTPPLSDDDRTRALVDVLERKLFVQADESTIRISLEWSNPQTAHEIVALAERNFFAGRSAVEVAVIGDTIGILTSEADRQREAVDAAFTHVVQLSRETAEADEPAPAAAPAPARPRLVQAAPPRAPAAPVDTKVASLLDDKRRAIRALDEPRQRRLADLDAQRSRLLMTYTEAHPAVLQLDAELRVLRVEPAELADLRREERELVAQLADLASPERRTTPRVAPRRVFATAPTGLTGPAISVDASPREDDPELASAKAKLLVSTRRYEDLMDRIDSARIELHAAQAAFKYRYVVVQPPEVPKEANRPSTALLLLGGLVLSALLAFFTAAAADLAGGRFVEPSQVRRRLAVPLLAEIDAP